MYPFVSLLKFFIGFMDPNTGKKNLFNKLNKHQAIEKVNGELFNRRTVSFYKYVLLDSPNKLRDELFAEWDALGVLGRIYLSHEGINGQISIPRKNWNTFVNQFYTYSFFKDIPFKKAVEDNGKSFFKLAIKVRNQIVADGLSKDKYDVTNVGEHLSAKEWNYAMREGATVVDMRNHYESEIGRFKGAICPDVETFKEGLPKVKEMLEGQENRKILLYCTGGIRCEKTSAYLKHHGFKNVNQLHGGIIDYVRQTQKNKSLINKFEGKNFVFDERLSESVSHKIISNCHQCGAQSDSHINCRNVNCNLLFLQCDSCREKHKECCSPKCIKSIQLSQEEQLILRKGTKNNKRFHSHKKIDLKKAFEDNK